MANYSFTFKDELSHHGIDGQKWGVRNGPPYPLAAGDHSKAELRAMKKSNKHSYKVIKRANKKSWKHKNAMNESENLSNKVVESIHKHGDEIRSIDKNTDYPKEILLYVTCKKIANDVLGEYANKPIYTKTKQKKGLRTVSKTKEYIGTASQILAEALIDEVSYMYD